MKLEAVTRENLEEFFAYCRAHRLEVDDSYLYEEDLAEFQLGDENPTYVLKEEGKIVAAASLILDDYHRRGNRGRFRILHAVGNKPEAIRVLIEALQSSIREVEYVIVFIPDENPAMAKIVGKFDFYVERASCLLVRDTKDLPSLPVLPESFSLRTFQSGSDETNWITVRNLSFASLLGNQTPLVEEQVVKMTKDEDHLPGGMLLLFDGEQAVGIVRGAKDEYEDHPIMNIGPLAVVPGYQGRGLGRFLLRAAMGFGKEEGYDRVILCVNAENEGAKALYLKEEFVQVEGIRCFRRDKEIE